MANRLLYVDNLRVFCIFIVVFIHSAVTYSGIGSWYYVEHAEFSNAERLFFFFFQSHAQAFSMSLFFFIAGFFIPASLERKGTETFITDRLYRLGIPVLIYIFLIHPLCVKLAHPEVNIAQYLKEGITTLRIFSWTGPLWFALTLLIFSIVYSIVHPHLPKPRSNFRISVANILLTIALITILAFSIRIVAPIGTSYMNLQFCFFAAYVVIFYLGVRASKNNLIENITYRMGKHWMWVAFGVGLFIWFITLLFGKVLEGQMLITGGANVPAFLYAFWESFFCVTFIIALFGIAKFKFNKQNALMRFFSENVFGVYVFHAPILIGISILTKGIHIDVFLKFFFVAILAIIISLLASFMIRKIPEVGRVFN